MPPDPSPPDTGALVTGSRHEVLEHLLDLVAAAAAGHGSARTVVGEAGIGKTTLLDAVTAGAIEQGVRVIRLRGVEAEVELAWSGLAGLLDGMLDRLDQLTPGRAAAVRAALALEGGAADVQPFAIAVASRDLLVDAADTAPIVIVIDDLPWIDLSTRRVLAYVADRLEVERIAMFSSRLPDVDRSTDTGPTIELTALADADADTLLVGAGVSSPAARAALITAARGIPLVLLEAANMLSPDERAGRAELPYPLPVGRSGRQAAELVLDRVAPTVRTALVVAAAEPDGDLDRITRALAEQHLGVAELEAAAASGVVSLEGGRLAFRHPLIRSAAYYDAPRAAQRAAHRAISHTLPEASPIRAWHLARAALGPDEEVAAALDGAAATTVHRGAPALAARSWELASRLSPEPAGRAKRLRLAASATLDAGSAGEAGVLLDRADAVIVEHPDADDLIERIHREQLRCRLPLSKGGVSRPADGLRSMAADVATADPGLAVDLRFTALDEYIREGAFADMARTVAEVVDLRDVVDADRARRIDIAHGALLVVRGDAAGEPLLDRYLEMVGPDRSDADTHFLAEILGPALGVPAPQRRFRRAPRRARGRPPGPRCGAPARRRAGRSGHGALQPLVPCRPGGRAGSSRVGRERRHARARLTGSVRARHVLGRDRRRGPLRTGGHAPARRLGTRAARARAGRPGLPGPEPGPPRRRGRHLPPDRHGLADRSRPDPLGDGVDRDPRAGRST